MVRISSYSQDRLIHDLKFDPEEIDIRLCERFEVKELRDLPRNAMEALPVKTVGDYVRLCAAAAAKVNHTSQP